MGYVGLPLAVAVFNAGFPIIGFDVDDKKIEHLNNGTPYLEHLGSDFAKGFVDSERFLGTTDATSLANADIISICVPTPLGVHNEPDLTYVLESTRAVAKILRKGQLVVLESTTYPGTTRDEMLPILEESGLIHGEDFFLAYSPEREDPGRKVKQRSPFQNLWVELMNPAAHLHMLFIPRLLTTRTLFLL